MVDRPKRLIRWPVVKAKTGVSRTSAFRLMRDGSFPLPVSIGERARAWIEDEIDVWITKRIAESRSAHTTP